MNFPNMLKLIVCCTFICYLTSCNKNGLNPKIWLHRSNDIAKAQYFEDKYAGLELDVHFDDSLHTFVVKHNADEVTNVTLDQWLSSLKNVKELGLWIDFKNLNENNKNEAVENLKLLRKKYKLKGKIYVESPQSRCLKVFKDWGFKTSFYIPPRNPAQLDKEKLTKLSAKISKAIKKDNITTISGYYYQYEFMRDSFPNMNKLLWYHEHDVNKRNKYIDIANKDDKIEILLVADDMPK